MRLGRNFLAAALAAWALIGVQAEAYQVSPLIVDVAPSGRNAAAEIRIQNTEAEAIAVEIEIVERTIDAEGRETTTPAEDVSALPPQALVQPGATQVLRLRYIGDPAIRSARNFTATVRQLPVSLENGEARGRLALVVNFGVSFNVIPQGARAAVEVIAATFSDGAAAVQLRNTGDNYASLAAMQWSFSNAQGQAYSVSGGTIRSSMGVVLLQAHAERALTIQLPPGFSGQGLALRLAPAGSSP